MHYKNKLIIKIQQAPNFFNKAPVIIDLKQININTAQEDSANKTEINFVELEKIINNSKLILVGIKNANAKQQSLAINENLAILRDNTPIKTSRSSTKKQSIEKINIKPQEEINNPSGNRLIITPIRSGQQIYVPNGDLIVTASVSHGAELLADGNIHVYGALRGRALAGINGNKGARIFCTSLEAELVSIAGEFQISEDIERQAWKIPAEISFKEEHLQIREL